MQVMECFIVAMRKRVIESWSGVSQTSSCVVYSCCSKTVEHRHSSILHGSVKATVNCSPIQHTHSHKCAWHSCCDKMFLASRILRSKNDIAQQKRPARGRFRCAIFCFPTATSIPLDPFPFPHLGGHGLGDFGLLLWSQLLEGSGGNLSIWRLLQVLER